MSDLAPNTAGGRLLLGLLEVGATTKLRAVLRHAPSGFEFSTALILERRGLTARIVGRNAGLGEWYLTPDGEAEARRMVREMAANA